jgi:FKBP-type peptidyl-prolyl cis-trans isomerase 2
LSIHQVPRMKTIQFLLLAALLAVGSGCTGLPEGAADFGDTVTVRVAVMDANGTALRPERTATFTLGSGGSGLGLGFEREVRGLVQGENATFSVSDDPSLGFTTPKSVPRHLQPITMRQDAPRSDFEASLGPASVGQEFDAFYIYTGTVTGVTATRVNFTITTSTLDANGQPTVQEDAVPVGATLVTTPDGTFLQRELRPIVGATFTINPPTPQQPAPLGLAPGTYRTLGATEDEIQYAYSSSGSTDLIGRDLRFKVTVLRIVAGDHEVAPVCEDEEQQKGCNYASRDAPYLNGDPDSVLGAPLEAADGDDHTH